MHKIQVVIFLGIVFTLYGLIYYYFYRRFIKPLGLGKTSLRLAAAGLFVFMYSSFIPFFMIRFRKEEVGPLAWIAWLIFGFIFTLFPVLTGKDILAGIVHIFKKKFRKLFSSGEKTQAAVEDVSRRDFLLKTNYAALGLSVMLTGFGVVQARRPPQVRRVSIGISDLPERLAGLKIAQVSDIHIGLLLDGKYLADIVARVNELRPDIVVITGDLVDGTVSQLKNDMACLANLAPVYGSYFVTGNHEYYSGVEQWLPEIERLGVKVLLNSHDVIRYNNSGRGKKPGKAGEKFGKQNLVIAGVPDHRAGPVAGHPYDPQKAVEGTRPEDFKILLAHQPVAIDQSLAAGFHLQLSGHTHGGQFFPYNLGVSLFFRYSAGLYRHVGPDNKSMWVYVNRGTGYWGPPMRSLRGSEITLLTLE